MKHFSQAQHNQWSSISSHLGEFLRTNISLWLSDELKIIKSPWVTRGPLFCLVWFSHCRHWGWIDFSTAQGNAWSYCLQTSLYWYMWVGKLFVECGCMGHELKLITFYVQKHIAALDTVETPYNTAPYITGSNIARLGHGSQNSWSKLWIPIVKSAPVRVIFTWKSVPKKSIHGSSDIYLGTRLPVVLPFRCHCHLPLLWHNRHYMTPWSSIHGQEGLIDANCICLRFTGMWAHRHRHPADSCLQARWTRSVLPK